MFRTSAVTAVGVALLFSVMIKGLPLLPPVKVPMVVPPYLTVLPLTPICPAPVP